MAAYHRRLTGNDEAAKLEAARAWSIWEGRTITLLPDPALAAHFADGHYALAFARIENHYFVNQASSRKASCCATRIASPASRA